MIEHEFNDIYIYRCYIKDVPKPSGHHQKATVFASFFLESPIITAKWCRIFMKLSRLQQRHQRQPTGTTVAKDLGTAESHQRRGGSTLW